MTAPHRIALLAVVTASAWLIAPAARASDSYPHVIENALDTPCPPACTTCHGDSFCLDCHANIPREHRVMHGPVVVNECQMCHSPHSSALEHLLRLPSPALCTQCHEIPELKTLHKGQFDPNASCITCHSGHGGKDSRLLLANSITPAATRPSPQSEVPR